MTRRGWLLFLAMGFIWGIPYLLIKVAIRDFEPGTLVFARTAPATVLLLPLALRQASWASVVRSWRWVLLYTAVEVAVPWLLLATAEQRVTSAFAGLLVAAVPLVGALIVLIVGGDDRFTPRRVVGVLIGLAGVAALVGLDIHADNVWAVLEIVTVAVCYATGPFIVTRRLADVSSLDVVTVSVAATTIVYAPYALTNLPDHVSGRSLASVGVLSVVCTAVAFLVFFRLIAEVGPTRATVITYLNPAVAVVLGIAFLGEPFTAGIGIGLPVVLLGSFLATGRAQPSVDVGEEPAELAVTVAEP